MAAPVSNDDRERILAIIRNDPWRMDLLRTVRNAGLKDWAVGAGFVRAAVWDALSGYVAPTPLPDIDVLHFDPRAIGRHSDTRLEARLSKAMPGVPWSVRNQARMHRRNANRPYADTADAMAHWLETATCVGVHLDGTNNLHLLAPHGVADLMNMVVRPTPAGRRNRWDFDHRLRSKRWPAIWPRLTVRRV